MTGTLDNESKTHIANIGRMIEDMETDMRSNLGALYIMKTREIVNAIRGSGDMHQDAAHVANLKEAVMGHGNKRSVDSENAT
jgi:hypothetical protein